MQKYNYWLLNYMLKIGVFLPTNFFVTYCICTMGLWMVLQSHVLELKRSAMGWKLNPLHEGVVLKSSNWMHKLEKFMREKRHSSAIFVTAAALEQPCWKDMMEKIVSTYSFSLNSSMKNMIFLVHEEKKPFKCDRTD